MLSAALGETDTRDRVHRIREQRREASTLGLEDVHARDRKNPHTSNSDSEGEEQRVRVEERERAERDRDNSRSRPDDPETGDEAATSGVTATQSGLCRDRGIELGDREGLAGSEFRHPTQSPSYPPRVQKHHRTRPRSQRAREFRAAVLRPVCLPGGEKSSNSQRSKKWCFSLLEDTSSSHSVQ